MPTERERYVTEQGLPIYRVLFKRNQHQLPQLTLLESRWQEIDNPAEAISQRA